MFVSKGLVLWIDLRKGLYMRIVLTCAFAYDSLNDLRRPCGRQDIKLQLAAVHCVKTAQ